MEPTVDSPEEVFREEISKHKLYKHQKTRVSGGKERNGKVMTLSDEWIRKEKGLGAKPFSTDVNNILWTVASLGPMTVKEVKEYLDRELHKSHNSTSISATLSKLKNSPYLVRFKRSQGYAYSLGEKDLGKLRKFIGEETWRLRKGKTIREAQRPEEVVEFTIPDTALDPNLLKTPAAPTVAMLLEKLFSGLSLEITIRLK